MVPQNIMVGSSTDLRVELQQDVTQIENVVVQIGYGDAQTQFALAYKNYGFSEMHIR